MKKFIILILTALSLQGHAQQMSTSDSIQVFYDSLIYQLKTHYLYRADVDWESVHPIKAQALQAPTFGKSLSLCTALFDTIEGAHLNIFSDHGWYKWSKGREYVRADFHENFLTKYEQEPGFEVKVIDGQYGYIFIPGMLMIDLSQDSLNAVTQEMYDQIMKLNSQHKLKGWVIDLRLNVGGNVFPMLTALYHFLGNQPLYHCLDLDGKLISKVSLENGVIHDSEDQTDHATIIPSMQPDLEVPVALIIGILTASAGELIPISFSGRMNVFTVGEPSAGLTSANSLTQLPFEVKLTLTNSLMADRRLQYRKMITPEVIIEREANFDTLTEDANVVEAMRFLASFE